MATSAEFRGTERFEVLTRLGQGGMGSVYQVVDRQRNARLALKTVGRVGGDALLRFKREFRALQELHHPNVVELGELFEKDGEWFFTMELVSGTDFLLYNRPITSLTSLDPSTAPATALTELDPTHNEQGSRLTAHPMARLDVGFDEVRLRKSLAQLAEALHALHRHGHVHRDIKPGNVLVADDGRVVLIDFGLIAGLRDVQMSADYNVVGTVAYMSPEQGVAHGIGPESDWYSVGVMLYEVLTGIKPISGSGLQLLMRKQSEVPRRPREWLRGIPEDLDALCMDLLEIDPRKRPTDRTILRRLHVDVARARGPSTLSSERVEEFVGRDRELDVLAGELERVIAGAPSLVTVIGRSGLGKSALLRRFSAKVATDHVEALVLEGRCYEQESVPYKALDAVMDQLSLWLKRQNTATINALLPPDVALLERAFPVLQRVPAIARARRDAEDVRDPQQRRLRVMRSLRALFAAVARFVPTVVLIDDFQWSDEDSQRMIDELLAFPEPPPLMLLFATRTDEQVKAPHGVEVRLEPLSEAQSIDLAERLARQLGEVDRARIEAVARQAEGFPFFVEAMLQQSVAHHPSEHLDLDAVIGSAVATLDIVARRLIEVVCCAGAPIGQNIAALAAETSPAELSHQMKTLRRLKLVRTGGLRSTDKVEPYHDRIRASVVHALADSARRSIHLDLGRAFESQRAEPEQIAHHFRAAGDAQRATIYLIAAAERASGALAFARAAELYADAESLGELSVSELRRVRIERGRALASSGRGKLAAEAFTLALPGSTPEEELDLKRRIAEQLLIAGWHEDGLKAADTFLSVLGIHFPRSPRLAFAEVAALEIWLRIRGLAFTLVSDDRLPRDELQRVDAYWAVAKGLAAHDPIRAQSFQARGLLAALDLGESHRIARALSMHALSVAVLDPTARPRANAILATARKLADPERDPLAHGLAEMVSGMLDPIINCRWAGLAVDAAEQMLRTKCEDVAWELDFCAIIKKQCLYYTGEWRRLQLDVRDQLKEADERGDRNLGVQIRSHWSSFLAALEGDYQRGHAEVDFALGPTPSPVEALLNLIAHARVDLCEGRADVTLTRFASYEPGLVGSLTLRTTIYRTLFESTRLSAMLAAARSSDGAKREKLYREAETLARRLHRKGVDCTAPLSSLGRAAVTAARGEIAESIRLLTDAERGFAEQSMAAHRAVAQRRRGQLIGGDEGRSLCAEGERFLERQGVTNTVAVSRLLGPGFPAEA